MNRDTILLFQEPERYFFPHMKGIAYAPFRIRNQKLRYWLYLAAKRFPFYAHRFFLADGNTCLRMHNWSFSLTLVMFLASNAISGVKTRTAASACFTGTSSPKTAVTCGHFPILTASIPRTEKTAKNTGCTIIISFITAESPLSGKTNAQTICIF